MAIDLEQFHQVFFEESFEGLDLMEQALLNIGPHNETPETINTIFRAAHSIKGGSGTFGFTAVTDFTHVLETLLDEARDGKRQLTSEIIELLLESCDCLRHMMQQLSSGNPVDDNQSQPLRAKFEALLQQDPESPTMTGNNHEAVVRDCVDALLCAPLPKDDKADDNAREPTDVPHNEWIIHFAPEPQILLTGNEPLRLFRELGSLGELTICADVTNIPALNQLAADECYIHWTLTLRTPADKNRITEVFDWVLDECKLDVSPAPKTDVAQHNNTDAESSPPLQRAATAEPTKDLTPVSAVTTSTEPNKDTHTAIPSNTSIRVGIDKVDSLINLVGELVITQSMLSELGNNFDMNKVEKLSQGLEQLLQNTKELQESVMQIRMLPISFAFNRFPRMIRDLAAKTDKKIELKLSGEQTELDKTVMEQIGDPLVHLVRNAIDHGLEPAAQRLNAGKPETGTIALNAYHQGGNIVIEIADDGRGLNTEKILAKARDKGIVDSGATLSEAHIYELIFEPGFSTAEVVSDISGRGVGMDVVRRNIKQLGGRIEVESVLGQGTTFKIYLPLTLAILDGQLVRVGSETYIIPLIAIVESLQIKTDLVNKVSGHMLLYRLREDNVPIIPVYQEFGIEAENKELENGLLVVVEGDGQKIGLLVDDLLAQQQVVIKSLESNYKAVRGISGATILGDGSVALILDIPGLITLASNRSYNRLKQNRAA